MKWARRLTGHTTRVRYWSSSNLANYLKSNAGVERPLALSWEGWDKWHTYYKEKAPLTYWFTEEFLCNLQDILYLPKDVYSNIWCKLHNIFISKTQYLQTRLNRGQYYDIDYRFLHAVFETLAIFVEVEKGNRWWKGNKVTARERGLAYLDWEINETEGDQARSAEEIKKLYIWWKDNYPVRPDIDYKCDNWFEAKEARYKFDTEQVVRVIRLRQHLWN